MNYDKKTKIVCTIGPASWDPEVMRKMIENGMNVARVNGAFADRAELEKVTKLIKDVSDDVLLMVDVKGHEVRMNKFAEAKPVKPGDKIIIGSTEEDEIYPANYPEVYKYVNPGQRVVVGDGDVELVVDSIEDGKMHCTVVYGELFKPGKALNLPGVEFESSILTEKDIQNLKDSIELGWDLVSASFIQTKEDAIEVNQYLKDSHMKLIAKIEDQKGIDNIEEILEEVEGVMIARGGLGVELGLEKVPPVQLKLVEACNKAGKPVIMATQMLESMIENPRPTRAEINDVATAVYLGADAVMLSGESTVGKYPAEAVKTLSKTSIEIEKTIKPKIIQHRAMGNTVVDALTKAAAELCIQMGDDIDTVLAASQTGRTARLLGRHRVSQSIYAFTTTDYYSRRMMLSKGVNRTFFLNKQYEDRDEALIGIVREALELGVIDENSNVLVVGVACEAFPNIFELVNVKELLEL